MANERVATIHAPPGGEELIFSHLVGHEEISRCFSFTLGFISMDLNIDPLKLLGKPLAVEAESNPQRWFHGYVSEFRLTRIEGRRGFYEAVIRPWLWFAGNTADCRIFQEMSVPDIVKKIFSKYGQPEVKWLLQGSYQPREYCVQYDESDLDFVQRLLEHEGIFYFFEHEEDVHRLVIADAMSQLKPASGYDIVTFQQDWTGVRHDKEVLTEWVPGSLVTSGAYAHTDYDFKKPAANLLTVSQSPFGHDQAEGEEYRQPGAHLDIGRGDAVAQIRREELQAPHIRIRAGGTVRGLFAGCTFTLEEFPRDDQNKKYLVVSSDFTLIDPENHAGTNKQADVFRVLLGVAPFDIPYRPPRVTYRTVMRGPQTATVVGPAGEEIFTDEYARVKVQFHWDRLGKNDENSSCFVRVSQTWAGAGWGFIQIPRIGQEVIVDFIEGDPDRPIITGRVYNAQQMPPYALPGNATQSGVKSNSSKGGGGWNEFRFEDKAGSEEVYFQAQKDHNLLIKHDRTKTVQHDQSDRIDNNAKHSVGVNLDEDVGNNKTTKVAVNRTVNIGSNDTETVGANRSLTVGANETIKIGANSTETIGSNHSQTVSLVQTVTVGAARVNSVGGPETRSVGAMQANTIGASRSVTVGAGQSHDVGASDSWSIGASQSVQIGADQAFKIAGAQHSEIGKTRITKIGTDDATQVGGAHELKIGKKSLTEIGDDAAIGVGKNLTIEAKDSITLKTGSATIVMKKDGTISIEGKDISVTASGKISMKASSDIAMKGSEIKQN